MRRPVIKVMFGGMIVEHEYEMSEVESTFVITGKELLEDKIEAVSQSWMKINKSTVHLAVKRTNGQLDLYSDDCSVKFEWKGE